MNKKDFRLGAAGEVYYNDKGADCFLFVGYLQGRNLERFIKDFERAEYERKILSDDSDSAK